MMFYLLGADNGLTNLGKSRQIGLFIFLVAFFWNSTQEILEVGAWSLKVNQKNCFQLLGYCYHDDTIIDNSDKLRQYIVLYIHNILKYIFLSVASKFVNKGPSEFDQYIMESWDMTSDTDPHTGVRVINVTMTLSRKIVNVFLVTYLPTILMNMINQATNYISAEDKYSLVYTINITCMMVLASVYLSVSDSLPPTSDIKPVEIWLIYNLGKAYKTKVWNFLVWKFHTLFFRFFKPSLSLPIHYYSGQRLVTGIYIIHKYIYIFYNNYQLTRVLRS